LGPFAEAEDGAAQADDVAGTQDDGADDAPVVDVGAGGAAGVGQDEVLAALADAGVQALDLGVAEQADVAALGLADGDLRLEQELLAPGAEALLDLQPGLLEDDLGQPDQEADAGPQGDEAPGGGHPQGAVVLVAEDAAEQAAQPQ